MRRFVFIQFGILISFIILTSIIKGWLNLNYWPLWVGAVLGSLIPAVDHLIYIYFTAPQELTSQRVKYVLAKKDYLGGVKLLYDTRRERTKLIFHTAYFQIILMILTIFVFTSSGSVFGKGLVLGFSLHLIIDQLMDFIEIKNTSGWFSNNPFISINPPTFRNSVIFCASLFLILIFLSIFF